MAAVLLLNAFWPNKKTQPLQVVFFILATRNGLEPSTSSVTGWRANRLHHRAKYEIGAGYGSRTRLCSLGSCRSTDELIPRAAGV